jgi:hypothetical protein
MRYKVEITYLTPAGGTHKIVTTAWDDNDLLEWVKYKVKNYSDTIVEISIHPETAAILT